MDILETVRAVLYRLSGISVRGLEDTGSMAWVLSTLLHLRQELEEVQAQAGKGGDGDA